MAGNTGPNIVNDGLVLYLDATNPFSYVSGSTTWSDLTVNGNNGTLTNGPTFSSANGGSIVFDGTNDYISVNNNASLNIKTGGFSENYWVKVNNTNYQRITCKRFGGLGYGYSSYINSNAFGYEILTPSTFIIMTTPTISSSVWYNICVTLSRNNTSYIYINGIAAANNNYSEFNGLDVSNNYNLTIGATDPEFPGAYLNGNMGMISLYNRTLSAIEVLQNYNAQKSRFGIF